MNFMDTIPASFFFRSSVCTGLFNEYQLYYSVIKNVKNITNCTHHDIYVMCYVYNINLFVSFQLSYDYIYFATTSLFRYEIPIT